LHSNPTTLSKYFLILENLSLLQQNITTSSSQKRYEKRYEPVRCIGNESLNCFALAGKDQISIAAKFILP
jgi:hypothetical protein